MKRCSPSSPATNNFEVVLSSAKDTRPLSSSGESVEENASVVVKLLIRRPECFGPALRGEGGNGLLAAMQGAIKISENPALDLPSQGYKTEV